MKGLAILVAMVGVWIGAVLWSVTRSIDAGVR